MILNDNNREYTKITKNIFTAIYDAFLISKKII